MSTKSENPESRVNAGVSAGRIINATAVDPDGRPVGTIADIVIEPSRGLVAFIILQHRDRAGRPRRFAIPPAGFEFTDDGAVVRIDPATLQRSPGRW